MQIEYLSMGRSDLRDMGDYFRLVGGNKLAARMIASVKIEIGVLRDFAEVAPVYELAPGIRRLIVAGGNFLVFYRIDATVQILHIRCAERLPVSAEALLA